MSAADHLSTQQFKDAPCSECGHSVPAIYERSHASWHGAHPEASTEAHNPR